jgi:hypothetical protein
MRFLIALGAACALFVGAAVLGWIQYKLQPQGMLFYTPTGRCPDLTHSFGVGFTLGVVVACVGSAIVSFMCLTASVVTARAGPKLAFRRAAVSSILVVPFLYALWFTQPVFESLLPKQAVPGCPRPAS